MKIFDIYNSPVGELYFVEEIARDKSFLVEISYTKPNDIKRGKSDFLELCKKEMEEYFDGRRKSFTIPLKFYGTDFQKSVWNALLKIPYGKTCSYEDVAKMVGSPKSCRAVGMANNKNPISIVVPCHRVIGKNGKMVGYGGGIEKKIYLLSLEKESI